MRNFSCAIALVNVAPTPGRLGVATHLYNAMIHPLMNHTIKGVVWYQGESNGGDPEGYSCLQPAMIKRWREGWAAGSNTDAAFPFGLVQLAGNTGDTFGLPQFRWLGQTDGYGVLDIYYRWRPDDPGMESMTVDLGIENLLDKSYAKRYATLRETGRNYVARVNYTW